MKQEDKHLLLIDLSARLPYKVKGVYARTDIKNLSICEITTHLYGEMENSFNGKEKYEFIPYLRPMSSMTEKELKELNEKYGNIAYFFIQEPPYYHGLQAQHSDIGSIEISEFSGIYDWLNEHHFDYRGLIEKGLALEAAEGMYRIDL